MDKANLDKNTIGSDPNNQSDENSGDLPFKLKKTELEAGSSLYEDQDFNEGQVSDSFNQKINFRYTFDARSTQGYEKRKIFTPIENVASNINVHRGEIESDPIHNPLIDFESHAYHSQSSNWIDPLNFDKTYSLLALDSFNVDTTNNAPVGINFSSTSFNENIGIGSIVANLSTLDATSRDYHTYRFYDNSVNGISDNDYFYISGNKLGIRHSPNFEYQDSYSLAIRVTDKSGRSFNKSITLKVNDIDDSGRDFFVGHNNGLNATNTWSQLLGSNPYIGGQMTDYKWGHTDPDDNGWTDLEYFIYGGNGAAGTTETRFGLTFYAASPDERTAILATHAAYTEVARVTFKEQKEYDHDKRNIAWGLIDGQQFPTIPGLLGIADFPDGGTHDGLTRVVRDRYTSGTTKLPIANSIQPGSPYFITYTHELGHSVGLSHPHHNASQGGWTTFPGVTHNVSNQLGDNNLNASPYSVMTYNHVNMTSLTPSTWGAPYCGCLTCLGAFDIAATQYLYGPNTFTRRGDDTYDLNSMSTGFKCIWDAAGEDTFDGSNCTKSVTIDLRNATLQNAVGGGGWVSQIGGDLNGYTIAYNSTGSCIIENGTGSNFNDIITGNEYQNTLKGLNGNDVLSGLGGIDTIEGGAGNDTLKGTYNGDTTKTMDILTGGAGMDCFELGDAAGSFYDDHSIYDFANIKDFNLTDDTLKLNKNNTYITQMTTIGYAEPIVGTGIYIDTNTNGQVDMGEELIAVLSNHDQNLVTMGQINQTLV